GDRSERPPARRREPEGEGAEGRRPADRARPRFLRRLCIGRTRERARERVVRTLEPPSHRGGVQGVCPRAARRLCARRTTGEDAAEHEGVAVIALIDYGAGTLASVRKALTVLGAEFATPSSPGGRARFSALSVP